MMINTTQMEDEERNKEMTKNTIIEYLLNETDGIKDSNTLANAASILQSICSDMGYQSVLEINAWDDQGDPYGVSYKKEEIYACVKLLDALVEANHIQVWSVSDID